ncbi:unnamed protein product [Candidula unifasciata]|uniref:Uncharacterized protein n=1 Tax=Candidula unifasciata TaxID=100452 RepID=A0A8S3YZK1_9EUPU|nr:unnamed protein product [Candidula unifasciata]
MNRPGDTAIHRACACGHSSIVQALMAAGVNVKDISHTNCDRSSLLTICAKRQNVSTVHPLLQAGTRIKDRDNLYDIDDSPLIQATRQSQVDIMHILAVAGADVNSKNTLGQFSLSTAILYKNSDAVKCLLAHKSGH